MKAIIYNIIGAVFIVSMSIGCEDALIERPKSIISPGEFFNSEDQCIQATNGSYSMLPTLFGDQELWALTYPGTDLFLFNGGSQYIYSYQEFEHEPSPGGPTNSIWNRCYTAIKNVNLVISGVSSAPINDQVKFRLLGENKYLRALYYYVLSNTFGDVPLWVDELDVDKVSVLARTPLADVRKQMIQDLTDAVEGLPWPSEYGSEDEGRVTKGAALGLLAKVYLFEKDYANAKKAAEEIIASGEYTLLPEYSSVFDVNNKNNKESIFEIQYKRDAATNTNYVTNFYYTWFFPLPDASGGTYAGVDFGPVNLISYHEFYPTDKLIALYGPDDSRYDEVIAYGYEGQPFTSGPVAGKPWFGPKFWDLTASQRASHKNLYFMRYAEIILILAEAENELNNTNQAIAQLNKIRFRATGSEDVPTTLSQEEVRQFIMDERARELVGEFTRRWDLGRWGTLVEAIKSIADENEVGAQNVEPHHKFFPISHDEIVKNPNLEQTDGYL